MEAQTSPSRSFRRLWLALGGLATLALLGACRDSNGAPPDARDVRSAAQGAACMCPNQSTTIGQWARWPSKPRKTASSAFWKRWGDGKAELSSYKAKVDRYGQIRDAELVLIYVTEPMNRRTWIKDDNAKGSHRVSVLKLNVSLKFTTGIYPYSVLASIFAPVDHWRDERFSPAKISLSVQEWCGHVHVAVWPSSQRYLHQLNSYFASEGENREIVSVPDAHLYEDALLIQLRELDGPFAQGKNWQGKVTPTLWRTRKRHRPLRPQAATITRSTAKRNGVPVHRFVLTYTDSGFKRTFDVEATGAKRLLGWHATDGETVTLHKTMRLPYWTLNSNSDAPARKKLLP